jgi:tetratricopeptide (TPR) repeat protein
MAIEREAIVRRAERHLQQGRLDGAIDECARLVEAAPRDWNARNALGDLYARRGDTARATAQFLKVAQYLEQEGFLPRAAAVEWFERAAEAPAREASDNHAVLYALADALERCGEPARALAVLLELDADTSGYRDVSTRIETLRARVRREPLP